MTDERKKHADEQPAETSDGFDELKNATDAALGEEDVADDDDAPNNDEAIAILIEGLKGENADLKDKYLRLAADMDNLRRRTERDVKDAKAYAIANFARDMLGVSDNLRRALDAIPAGEREAGNAGFNSLVEGVEMTERAMLSALERHGVKKQTPESQKFDPNFHQAMFEVPNPDVPSNTVVQVVQDGYVIGERVLRPAMVGVAKGGPKQPVEQPRADNDDGAEADGDAEPGAPNAQSEKDA